MNKKLQILSLAVVILMAGCFDISEVEQPELAVVGQHIQNVFLMKTYEADANPHNLIVGLLIPSDWSVDSVYYEGDVFGPDYCTFLHNDSLDANLGGQIDLGWTDSLTAHYPPAAGMEWVVYQGVTAYASATADTAYTDVFVDLTVGSSGTFELGYFISNASLDFSESGYYDEALGYSITTTMPVAIDVEGFLPTAMALEQNYPNPFNPSTSINFSIPTDGIVNMMIHDLSGREIATLHNGVLPAGNYVKTWNGLTNSGAQVPSGMYIYRLESASGVMSQKMMLLK